VDNIYKWVCNSYIMNQDIYSSQLLAKYEKITAEIYLRTDSKAIAIVTNDNDTAKIGFLTITPKSRKELVGIGLVLEGSVLETIIATTQNNQPLSKNPLIINGLLSNISTYLKEDNNTNNLIITKDQILKFESENSKNDKDNLAKYLHNFAQIPCQEYSSNSFENKIKTAINNTKVKYSPTMAKERKILLTQLKEKIPDLIDQMYGLLQMIEDKYSTEIVNNTNDKTKKIISEIESLSGEKVTKLINLSRKELNRIIPKLEQNIKSKMEFNATPAYHYNLTTLINNYNNSIQINKRDRFELNSKNNC